MVEKVKEAVNNTVQVPVWVLMLLVPILITIFVTLISVTMTQSSAQARLQLQADVNKANIEMLRTTKADVLLLTRFENTLNRIEIKIDEHISNDHNP